MLEQGHPFPDFELADQNGHIHTLDSLKGSPTIVYFYPKDDTSGCTVEACGFRDALPQFSGAKVLGVSPDDVASHKQFAEKYGLNFPLLADPERALIEPVGVWAQKSMYGKSYMGVERTTFLLDAQGIVHTVWRKVSPEGHAAKVFAALSEL